MREEVFQREETSDADDGKDDEARDTGNAQGFEVWSVHD